MIKEQIAYQLLLNKRSGRSFTHESDLGVSKTTAQKLILGGIIKWHEGDYYSVTQEAASWVQRKHPHDMMLTPRRGTT